MALLKDIRSCTLCQDELPLEPRPILQFSRKSKMLLIGQAPGLKAHETHRPWNDPSGVRLREWLRMSEKEFYQADRLAIIPMGLCYPGRGASGDLPPRPECRVRWMDSILCHLKEVKLKILVGTYATEYFLGKGSLTEQIKEHSFSDSSFIVLPHPSPRNNIWLAKNKWFEHESLPLIQQKIITFP
ncbi:MAG: uracil-DNA glycosylase family protein [Bacteriovoracaceae bacterium]|nr:uracil-DNA glycosylase family protein [Bacteriovoracaceae bacterium]